MATAEAPPARSGIGRLIKRLLSLLVFTALVLAVGFGAGWYYFAREISPADEVLRLLAAPEGEETEPEPQRVPRVVPQDAFLTSYYQFEDSLTTNLRGSRQFLQVRIGVSTQYDAMVVANVETHKLALQSDILGVIGAFSEADLDAEGGRDALAAAIRDAMNARLLAMEGFGGIEGVFFTSFIRQ